MFLAEFGPGPTAIRKLGHYLLCPEQFKKNVTPPDAKRLIDPRNNCTQVEVNAFTVDGGSRRMTISNDPFVDTSSSYLVDTSGERYESWQNVFDWIKTITS
jgi:hypothetical protein